MRGRVYELVTHFLGQLLLRHIANGPDVCLMLAVSAANRMPGHSRDAALAVLLAGEFRYDRAVAILC